MPHFLLLIDLCSHCLFHIINYQDLIFSLDAGLPKIPFEK